MACWESSIHASNHCHNNSDELDVFAATRYFSGYTDVALVTSNPGSHNSRVLNPCGYCASLPDKRTTQPSSRVPRESLDVPTTIAQIASNDTIVRGDQGRVSRDKILRQPSSPGGKIMSFMKSLFNLSSSAKGIREKVRNTTATCSQKDRDEINLGGWWRRRRSSIGYFWTSSAVADSKSLPRINRTIPSFSCVHSDSRTPSSSNIVDVPWDSSHRRQAAVSVSIRNRAREELAKWEASYVAEEARNTSNHVVDCDYDGYESNSSSDLFELPVYDSTGIESVCRSSMSTVSTGSATMKLHV